MKILLSFFAVFTVWLLLLAYREFKRVFDIDEDQVLIVRLSWMGVLVGFLLFAISRIVL